MLHGTASQPGFLERLGPWGPGWGLGQPTAVRPQDARILRVSCRGSTFPPKGHANNTIVYFSHDMQRWEADGVEIVPHNVNRNLEGNKTHGDRDSVAKSA